jgi:hypothetical protein
LTATELEKRIIAFKMQNIQGDNQSAEAAHKGLA